MRVEGVAAALALLVLAGGCTQTRASATWEQVSGLHVDGYATTKCDVTSSDVACFESRSRVDVEKAADEFFAALEREGVIRRGGPDCATAGLGMGCTVVGDTLDGPVSVATSAVLDDAGAVIGVAVQAGLMRAAESVDE